MNECRFGSITRVQHVRRAFVIPFFGNERTNQRNVVQLLGHLREQVGNPGARDRGVDRADFAADIRAGMRVPGFKLACPPLQPDRQKRLGTFGTPSLGRS